MSLHFDIFSRTFDDSVPAFLLLEGGGDWDRIGRRYYAAGELDLVAKHKKGYVFPPHERGLVPQAYREANPGPPYLVEEPAPPPEVPDTSWTKARILEWLEKQGVSIAERHLEKLSKVELLSFIDDLQDLP